MRIAALAIAVLPTLRTSVLGTELRPVANAPVSALVIGRKLTVKQRSSQRWENLALVAISKRKEQMVLGSTDQKKYKEKVIDGR